ncbi:hypothetical protein ACKVMY_03620 [Vibrio natriegens]|uniref:hypothetical protein n=1 Tax=Vibrio natriegens TaxID=691 RepID=UPI002F330AE1|nr:hypothetical protein [Vibrio parahaemolyticus]EKK9973566.1 hypothetical protein [Vibrio parahaemolyticus]
MDKKAKFGGVTQVVELIDETFDKWLEIKMQDSSFKLYSDGSVNCAYPKGYTGVDADRVLWRDLKFANIYKRNLVAADCFYRVFYSNGCNSYRTYVNREFAEILDKLFDGEM